MRRQKGTRDLACPRVGLLPCGATDRGQRRPVRTSVFQPPSGRQRAGLRQGSEGPVDEVGPGG